MAEPDWRRFVDRLRGCRYPGCMTPFAIDQHHVVYRQEVRREGGDIWDGRNALALCDSCHSRHHARSAVFPIAALRDENFEFARELLGGPKAYEYLRRRYAGADPRLEALLNEEEDTTMEERTFPCGKSEPEGRVAIVAQFLDDYEADMHLEARGEPFAFASREHAAEKLLERLGLGLGR
jgi:hypothetical protein